MKINTFVFCFLLQGFFGCLLAQNPVDENASDESVFQDYFYDALKEKAIENYDKAILSLEKCLKQQPNNPVLFSELGKNYLELKEYNNAYNAFEKAAQIDPTNKWYLVGMYDVDYETKDFEAGIAVITKLILLDPKYKDDLVALYMNTQQFDKALTLINELNKNVGKSGRRDEYKAQILSQPKFLNAEIENLQLLIKEQPTNESNYVTLINLYLKNVSTNKIIEISKKMAVQLPNADWSLPAMLEKNITENADEIAITTLIKLFKSSQINSVIKQQAFNKIIPIVNNKPALFPQIQQALGFLSTEETKIMSNDLATFYQKNQANNQAQTALEKLIENTEPSIKTVLHLLNKYDETQQYELLAKTASQQIETFPTETKLFYFAGLANNKLLQYKQAVAFLEQGLDFIIEDATAEKEFYQQLTIAYQGLGNSTKATLYAEKAKKK